MPTHLERKSGFIYPKRQKKREYLPMMNVYGLNASYRLWQMTWLTLVICIAFFTWGEAQAETASLSGLKRSVSEARVLLSSPELARLFGNVRPLQRWILVRMSAEESVYEVSNGVCTAQIIIRNEAPLRNPNAPSHPVWASILRKGTGCVP